MCGVDKGRETGSHPQRHGKRCAAEQQRDATTVCREKRFPKNPLMAAPISGSTGISQRCRLGVIV